MKSASRGEGDMSCFKGKKIVITGASSGIGFGIAKCFAEEGALTILIARNPEKLDNAVQQIIETGSTIYRYICDVSRHEEIENTCRKIIDETGVPDVLVNNAGGFMGKIQWNEITPELWEEAIATNLLSVYYFTRYFATSMKENGVKGAIINIGSSSALQVKSGKMQYTITKSGVHTMTKVFALDLAQYGIRVNSVSPGPTNVERIQKRLEDAELAAQEMERLKKIPLKRFGTVKDIADAVLFLASEKASFITGAILPVDGGYTIGPN